MISKLLQLSLHKAATSGITPNLFKQLKLEACSAADLIAAGIKPDDGHTLTAALKLPYYTPTREPTGFFRVRFLEDTRTSMLRSTDAKPMRYRQPPQTPPRAYFPLNLDWEEHLRDASRPVLLTEGELKAACACAHQLPCIGLGGVSAWRSRKLNWELLPELEKINWYARPTYIVFDSDAVTNSDVLREERKLARKLLEYGADVRIVRLPMTPDDRKQGLDDYLLSEGRNELIHLMDDNTNTIAGDSLQELSSEVVFVRANGAVVQRANKAIMSADAFKNASYANWKYRETTINKDGVPVDKDVPTAKAWIEWKSRATVEAMTYAPGEDEITKGESGWELNLWKGWGVPPVKGDISPWEELLDWSFNNKQPDAREWFERWCAYPLQHPGTKLYSAVLLWSVEHGTGKGIIGQSLKKIYGQNAITIEERDLASTYNDWAACRQFVMCEEMPGTESRRVLADQLKSAITRLEVVVNQKYVPHYRLPDRANFLFNSNHSDAFFLEDTDRRFFVNELSGKKLNRAFFDRYDKWLHGTGPSHLFHYLLQLPLGDFNPRAEALWTDSKAMMMEQGLSELGLWVRKLLVNPDEFGALKGFGDLVTASELLAIYDPMQAKRTTVNHLGRELNRANVVRFNDGGVVKTGHGTQRLIVLRNPERWLHAPIAEATAHYNEHRGLKDKSTATPTFPRYNARKPKY